MRKTIILLLVILPLCTFAQSDKLISLQQLADSLIGKTTATDHPQRILFVIDGYPEEDSLENKYIHLAAIESTYKFRATDITPNTCKPWPNVILITTKTWWDSGVADNEDGYDITVLDAGYDTFLKTQLPKEYYSVPYLKTKNTIMVSAWNSRHNQSLQFNPYIYEAPINYDPNISYGLDFEYKLYMFFLFMKEKYDIDYPVVKNL
ncbi:hypothetical protein M2451_003581 [Dysgonomonas sp. PFB1-18]|uniref:DUF6146 family protein n=1 Tax=unclassified Dysgonomonas TaxID=2630389 RepID=UPI002473C0CE|nr:MULTISPECIES: DUF6146 family protein [unclassified Dysgonomonas]MDH6310803.1 hypothetical protein [Dysgonomonas sp. PF1-14]MDH6340653.1 hypothetical protein [Dysgonomonas sp. PF1-16]MDH6382240.1 hypothetical protein [Dysgonomonas sp. PFB1-18]MDH6399623.1 hypothetical protein [Dysgonomonas sp. PF1-23]